MNDNTFEIEWAEPPPSRAGRATGVRDTRIKKFVAVLKDNPERWAKYGTFKTGGAAHAYRKAHPGTEWVARTNHDVPAGEPNVDLYARWVGFADEVDTDASTDVPLIPIS